MGAGGDGPCLASWLLRCAETSLSKWNPHPDWQAGRRAPSNRSSQLWLQLWRFPRVLEPVPCLDPPKELAASCACIQGSSDLFKICLVQRINLLTLPHTLVDHRPPLDQAQECKAKHCPPPP